MPTETLRPNADGDKKQWDLPSSGDHYDEVDETSPDEDSTYIAVLATNPAAERDLFQLPNPSNIQEGDTINSVKVYYRVRGTKYTSTRAMPVVKTHGTEYQGGTMQSFGTSYETKSYTWTTNPNTGNAWTLQELNNLQAGVEGTRGIGGGFPPQFDETRCTQVYIEVDYTPAPPPSESNQHSGTLLNPGVF